MKTIPSSNYFRAATENESSSMRLNTVKQSPNPFPWKLHEMLDDATRLNFDNIVSWIPEQNGFRVHDVPSFVKDVMPLYFNQSKYKSFQRQLNMWGFERLQYGNYKGGYTHDKFVKSQPALCSQMRRQKLKGGSSSAASSIKRKATSAAAQSSRKRKAPVTPVDVTSDVAIPAPTSLDISSSSQSFGRVSPTSAADIAAVDREQIECLIFGRTFFGIFDTDVLRKKSLGRGGQRNGSPCGAKLNYRRCSLDFLVPS